MDASRWSIPERLPNRYRVLIGLRWMGIVDLEQMAYLSHMSVRDVKRVLSSRYRAIKWGLKYGLPSHAAGRLQDRRVKCPRCSRMIVAVPCITCFTGTSGQSEPEIEDRRPLPEPTDTIPGTLERIKVLQKRVAMGHQIDHPGDMRFYAT